MNHYKHALVKEIAAQQAGFEPSYVWGRITQPIAPDKGRQRSEIIMNTDHPLHIPKDKHFNDIHQKANKFINNLPKEGVIKKEAFTQ